MTKNRPYFNKSIADLEKLHTDDGSGDTVLQQLRQELEFRTTARAAKLKNKIAKPTKATASKKEPKSPRVTLPALIFDVERYQKKLDDSDLNEDQKREFLLTLWSIMVGFVDLGYDIHPLQQADPERCGQDLDLTSFMAENVISSSKGISQKQFTDAADCSDEQDVERMES